MYSRSEESIENGISCIKNLCFEGHVDHVPLIPEKGRQICSLKANLHSRFQSSQGYLYSETLSQKKQKQSNKQTNKKPKKTQPKTKQRRGRGFREMAQWLKTLTSLLEEGSIGSTQHPHSGSQGQIESV